ncbi:hypothetical protein J6590_040410 [Homalodisca vitripennis]|nr:hypothetical protein J6590_040410 [Homalodisca vitripennis]
MKPRGLPMLLRDEVRGVDSAAIRVAAGARLALSQHAVSPPAIQPPQRPDHLNLELNCYNCIILLPNLYFSPTHDSFVNTVGARRYTIWD